ncbi:MAG: IS200/IS605 family transposase [Pseudomonadota bacterium]
MSNTSISTAASSVTIGASTVGEAAGVGPEWVSFQPAGGSVSNWRQQLAEQKESRLEEGHLMPEHAHMMLRIPPKYAVSQVVGYIKGKSAIHLARVYAERKRNFVGQHVWARGCLVSTVGRDEEVIRAYIRSQEAEGPRLEQLELSR